MIPPKRSELRPGVRVRIVEKKNQPTGALDRGGGDAHPDQQPDPPAWHQGHAGRRQGRAGSGDCYIGWGFL